MLKEENNDVSTEEKNDNNSKILFLSLFFFIVFSVVLGVCTDRPFTCSICEDETNHNKKLKICRRCEREIEKMISRVKK